MAAKYANEPKEWTPPRVRRSDHRRTFRGYDGCDYTAEEVEFMLAVEAYRRKHGPCKSPREALLVALRVAKEIGYRKI